MALTTRSRFQIPGRTSHLPRSSLSGSVRSIFSSGSLCCLGPPRISVVSTSLIMAAGASSIGWKSPAVTNPLLEEVTDPTCPVVKVLAQLDRNEIGLVAAADAIEAALDQIGHTYSSYISPNQVGFDPSNRDGEGGNAQHVFVLSGDIFDVGWSPEATSHATCVETLPNDRTVEIFNQNFSDGNGMPAVPDHSIRFGSISGSHTNYVLRCVAGGVVSTRADMCDSKGCFCLAVIGRRDPLFVKAAEQGLKWRVFRWQVRLLWPRALQVIQSARNVTAATCRPESEMQGLCQLHSLAAVAMARGEKPDWPQIKRAVLRSKPSWGHIADDMIVFVAAKSGGQHGTFLKAMTRFFRIFVDSSLRSSLPGGLYANLADSPWTFLCMALWVTAYTCPKEHVKFGSCLWVTVSDVKGLMYGSPAVKQTCNEAEDCLREARARLAKAGVKDVESNDTTKILTRLDMYVGRFVLKKQEASKTKFSSIAECGRQFVEDLKGQVPDIDESVYDDLWPRALSIAGLKVGGHEPKAADSHTIGLVSLDPATGQITEARALMRSSGFDIGATVKQNVVPVATVSQLVPKTIGAPSSGMAAPGVPGEAAAWSLKDQADLENSLERLFEGPSILKGIYKVLNVVGDVQTGLVTLELLPLSTAAFPVSMNVQLFLRHWVLADAREIVELHPGWPACRVSQTTLAKTLRAKGQILAAIGCLTELIDEVASAVGKVAVHLKPIRRVLATGFHDVGLLHLVPETTNIKAMTNEEYEATSRDDAAALIEVILDPPCLGHRFFLIGVTGPENMAPAWCVRTRVNDDEATCRRTTVSVQLLLGLEFEEAEFMPTLKRRRLFGKTPGNIDPAAKSRVKKEQIIEDAVIETKVIIPVLVNVAALHDGAELMWYKKEKTEKREQAVTPITMGVLTRQLRLGRLAAAVKASGEAAASATF